MSQPSLEMFNETNIKEIYDVILEICHSRSLRSLMKQILKIYMV
jgi:hypothetical protein